MNIITREYYADKIDHWLGRQQILVLTGQRRVGKSFILKDFTNRHAKDDSSNIIYVNKEKSQFDHIRTYSDLNEYIGSRFLKDKHNYILIDEIQEIQEWEKTVRSYRMEENADIIVTGSNSRMLSHDVATEFRGRGDELRLQPLCFKEYFDHVGGSREEALADYMLYGGMPLVLSKQTDAEKREYLSGLFAETYFKDIVERNKIAFPEVLGMLADELCSSVGSLTNSSKIADTLQSVRKLKIDSETIGAYLRYLTDCYLFSAARRYDVKGRKYFSYPNKYYCVDPGLCNARLNFRQIEETHLIENIIYNELLVRGFNVDVGVVEYRKRDGNGKIVETRAEVDFVCNKGNRRYYIQSAFAIPDKEKMEQEQASFDRIDDSFKKIIVLQQRTKPWRNEKGYLIINVIDFLLNPDSLEL